MNTMLCDKIYDHFASQYGIRTSREPGHPASKKHLCHNRELKRLRKSKVSAMRNLRQAQKERKPTEVVRALKGIYLRATRKYSKGLKRAKRAGEARTASRAKKECTESFWKFASRTLDVNASSHADPTFSMEDAEIFIAKTYSSTPHTFSQPAWLPTITEPEHGFDCDPIRLGSASLKGLRLPHPRAHMMQYHIKSLKSVHL